MFGPGDINHDGYDLERDFIYTRNCPICGGRMWPEFGGFHCEECDNFDWRRGIIIKKGDHHNESTWFMELPTCGCHRDSNPLSVH